MKCVIVSKLHPLFTVGLNNIPMYILVASVECISVVQREIPPHIQQHALENLPTRDGVLPDMNVHKGLHMGPVAREYYKLNTNPL